MAEKTKWSIKKRALLVVCSAALLCMNLVFFSLGWFTFHHHDDVNGITNRAVGDKFELFTEGIQPALPTNRPAGYTLAERL